MRKEAFTVGSYVHVYNRGNRKEPIVRDKKDRWHFLQLLFYCNSDLSLLNPIRTMQTMDRKNQISQNPFLWPDHLPARNPLVKILCFVLLENHFHLLLKEIQEGGISLFMRKLGTGMAMHFNKKYQEVGRLFQNSYRARTIDKDEYLTYLSVYIQLKNCFELYPHGLKQAINEFDKAFEWAVQYPYCSLGDYAGARNSLIIDKEVLGEIFPTPQEYRAFAKQCMLRMNLQARLGSLTFE